MNEEKDLKYIPLLVFANKSDLKDKMSINEITNTLDLNQFDKR